MAKLTGGEALVNSLLAHGVHTLFALPGVQNDWFFNALYDAENQIRVIHTRHEQGAAYMALGYAQSTGEVGAYSVVPGPGLLNTTAALSTAYATNDKVLCLTGQIASNSIGKGYGLLHELPDQLTILRALTKWAERINSPVEVPSLVAEAFRQLATGRPRPVGLEVPPDVLAATAEVDLTVPPMTITPPPLDEDALAAAGKLLAEAKQPMIFVGSGAIPAAEAVQELAELLQAPVVSSRTGHGVVSSRHPLSLRTPAAHVLWRDADVVLTIGSRLQNPLQNWGYDENLKLIRVDVDPAEHDRIASPTVSIVARSQEAVPALVAAVAKHVGVRASRAEEMNALKAEIEERSAFLAPQLGFINAIRAELPDDGIYVEEMTQVGYVARFAMPVYKPRTFITCSYQGTLGWGFATALGVKVANPDKPVISICGDGGFLFTVQELATAVQHKINTVTLIFNDGAYGNVQRMQKLNYGNRVIASELRNPDFVKLAESFGAQGLRAHNPDELRQAIRHGFAADVPTVIEIPVGEMPSPWPVSMLPRVRGVAA
jgi:acetolactate synthase-1/2/3 large subunit